MARKAPSDGSEFPLSVIAFLLSCADAATLKRVRARFASDQAKLELMIVRALNPVESLTNEEEGKLRGLNRHTVGELKSSKVIPQEPS